MMYKSTGGDFTRLPLSKYRAERWDQSRAENPNFFFGPGSLLLYGASSFLYELFPGSNYAADLTTMKSFFGAEEDGNGGWTHIPERAPPGWRNRVKPYDLNGAGSEIFAQYGANPKPFGVNTGDGNFLLFNEDGTPGFDISDADNVVCALYQLAVGVAPATVGGGPLNTVQQIKLAATKLNPIFADYPCPLILV
ncbi:hypothetical protein EJ05DRAFT_480894 [Pseudovirgaria hyperparasitica]|uniref:Heme haloperoxidase family profile domain-containing protein n=1 Tax=Pseudovirgaria hyperparasitica TaxID=470096 RepID=A0A6A6VQF7_9PEZI|nr:uncharacterized protein EJ05DRAFT_480894 [Pseudovirgaria hyperparasitica]KAF2752878.1 hypothetical protein EJ05DRAFT_480894 [Pseudovirgaria hyperparasitica]